MGKKYDAIDLFTSRIKGFIDPEKIKILENEKILYSWHLKPEKQIESFRKNSRHIFSVNCKDKYSNFKLGSISEKLFYISLHIRESKESNFDTEKKIFLDLFDLKQYDILIARYNLAEDRYNSKKKYTLPINEKMIKIFSNKNSFSKRMKEISHYSLWNNNDFKEFLWENLRGGNGDLSYDFSSKNLTITDNQMNLSPEDLSDSIEEYLKFLDKVGIK
jgi:hypothetical protein